MRNYTILNIAVDDAKIFKTKERAPLLLCIETFRPIEMTLEEPSEIYDIPEYKQIETTFSITDKKGINQAKSKIKKAKMKDAVQEFKHWSPEYKRRP